jgi:hypothetical protein
MVARNRLYTIAKQPSLIMALQRWRYHFNAAIGIELHFVDAHLAMEAGCAAHGNTVGTAKTMVNNVPLVFAGHLQYRIVAGTIYA